VHKRLRQSGMTLLEASATIAIVSIISVGLVTIGDRLASDRQIAATQDSMNELRRAISGNPVIVVNEGRTAFGYVGDMGNLPSSLEDLWVKGTQPAFSFDTAKKTGAGWNGPYLDVPIAEFAPAAAYDGWGNRFAYSNTSFTETTFGTTALGQLVSYGRNFVSGGGDDLTTAFFQSETVSRVQGYVKDTDGESVAGVLVTVNYPSGGTLTSSATTSDTVGYYALTNIPYGNRSITIEPKLVVVPGTVVASGPANDDLAFTVKNYSAADISLTSIKIAYTISPAAYFDQIRIGNTIVFSNTAPRYTPGSTVTFSTQTISGTGSIAESLPVRLQSAVTDVEDLIVGNIGRGGELAIQCNNFTDVLSGNGTSVDVTGVNFEFTFSDGSVVVVKP
jgi:hypothetical protein